MSFPKIHVNEICFKLANTQGDQSLALLNLSRIGEKNIKYKTPDAWKWTCRKRGHARTLRQKCKCSAKLKLSASHVKICNLPCYKISVQKRTNFKVKIVTEKLARLAAWLQSFRCDLLTFQMPPFGGKIVRVTAPMNSQLVFDHVMTLDRQRTWTFDWTCMIELKE